ncbi:MAG: TolC family protein [Flavobacteriales bacterium]
MRTSLACCALLSALGAWAQPLLTAEEAVRMAVEKNHGILLAKLNAESAQVANNAGAAGMLPTLDGTGLYSMDHASTKQQLFSGETRNANDANAQTVSAALTLNWRLFDGLGMFAAKDRLEALERIGGTQLRQQVEATGYDVLSNYYQLVQLEKALSVQRSSVRLSRERYAIAGTAKSVGTYSGLDVVQAQLDLNADSAQVVALQQQIAEARSALNQLLAREVSTPFRVDTVIPAAPPLEYEPLRQAARGANSALQLAREQHLAADLAVKKLKSALWPTLDGYADYGYSKTTSAVGLLQSSQRTGPDYGLRLNVPLFHGGVTDRVAKLGRIAQQQAATAEEQVMLDVDRQLLDTWNRYTNARQRVALEEGNLTGVRTQVNVALESYRVGVITAIQLRDVQRSLIDAENRLLLALFDAKQAELQLEWLAGRLL